MGLSAQQYRAAASPSSVQRSVRHDKHGKANDDRYSLQLLVQASGAAWAALLLREGDTPFALAESTSLPPTVRTTLEEQPDLFAGRTHADGALQYPSVIHLAEHMPPYTAYALQQRGHSTLTGVLVVGFACEPNLDERLRALLALGVEQVWLCLHTLRLQQRIGQLTSQLTAISKLGQRMTSLLDRQQLFQQITWLICESLGYDHTQLLLTNTQQQTIELVHASGPAGNALLHEKFCEQIGGKGIIGWVAGNGQIWVCNNVDEDPHFASHGLLRGTKAEIALPLQIGERVIGVLDVQCDQPYIFDDDDVFILQTVADQIAPALEHARLFTAERQERELATTLRDISHILCSSLDLDQVLDLILQQIGRVVPHRGARINLHIEGTTMRVVAAKGYQDNEEAKRATVDISTAPMAPLIMYDHQTVIVPDVRTDPRWVWLPGIQDVRSWCGVPLVIKDRCIGCLSVDWNAPDFFTEEHARIIRTFADQAAVAIENARLYAAVKEFNEQLDHMVRQRTAELHQAKDEISQKAGQLQALVHRVVKVQEEERQRIAHDLHDSVTQSISAVLFELQALKRWLGGQPAVDQRFDDVQQLLSNILLEIKHIIHALRPPVLDELGLVAALESFVAAARQHYCLNLTFHTQGLAYHLAPDAELGMYRVAQEAIHNSIRHARARTIRIGLVFLPGQCRLEVADDGNGFDPHQASGGLGLASMRERAQSLGGQIAIASAPQQGTQVVFTLHIAHGASAETQ